MLERKTAPAAERQRKVIPDAQLELKSGEEGDVVVLAYVCGPPDLDGDVIAPTAFTAGDVCVISQWNHSGFSDALPAGLGALRVDGKRILVVGRFFLGTPHGLASYNTVKELGARAEWSIGYQVLKQREPTADEFDRGVRRVILKLRVFEISPVLRGAAGEGRSGTVSIKSAALSPKTVAALAEIDKLTSEIKELNRQQRALLIEESPRLYEVDHATRIAAERGVKLATAILAQAEATKQAPQIRWLKPEVAREMKSFGFVYPQFTDEVWLKDTMEPSLAFNVAAHETYHAFRVAGLTTGDVKRHEEDAARFGEALMKIDATGLPVRIGRRESTRTTKCRSEVLIDPELRVHIARRVPDGDEIDGSWSVPDPDWQQPERIPGAYLSPHFDPRSDQPRMVEMHWEEMFILA